jgi:hypothetical protein
MYEIGKGDAIPFIRLAAFWTIFFTSKKRMTAV